VTLRYILQEFDEPLVLPDTVVCVLTERGIGLPMMGRDASMRFMVLPVSVNRCLAGFPDEPFPLAARDINRYAFDASSNFVIAHPQWSADETFMVRFGVGPKQLAAEFGAKARGDR
jgi:hypothetical protein